MFAWVLLPGHLIHEAFASHHDTDDEECHLYHKHLGIHFEEKHVHCDIFRTNAPLYEQPQVTSFPQPIYELLFELSERISNLCIHTFSYSLPARAPPVNLA